MRSQEVRRLPEAASAIQTQSSGIAALVPKQRAASFWESLFSGAFPFFVRGPDECEGDALAGMFHPSRKVWSVRYRRRPVPAGKSPHRASGVSIACVQNTGSRMSASRCFLMSSSQRILQASLAKSPSEAPEAVVLDVRKVSARCCETR